MKRVFLTTGLVSLFIFSCSKKESPEIQNSSDLSVPSVPTSENSTGEQIVGRLDCSACHSKGEKMIGPSYQEIAEKYSEKDIEMLASKIIEGGVGNWGSVPMTPHSQVSKEDAKKMVEYILSQKK